MKYQGRILNLNDETKTPEDQSHNIPAAQRGVDVEVLSHDGNPVLDGEGKPVTKKCLVVFIEEPSDEQIQERVYFMDGVSNTQQGETRPWFMKSSNFSHITRFKNRFGKTTNRMIPVMVRDHSMKIGIQLEMAEFTENGRPHPGQQCTFADNLHFNNPVEAPKPVETVTRDANKLAEQS